MKPGFVAGMFVLTALMAVAILGLPSPAFSHKPITTNILFKNEVAQIFQRKCFQCHSDNNLSMSLTTYTEARPWARAIREEILDREMPPWTAVAGFGHFSNDISLSAREKDIIISWADGGAPSGVPRAEESIPPVYVPPAPSWDHGEPDLVIPIGKGQRVEAGAPFEVRRFVVSTGLTTATSVHAIALKQGDRRVVRHAAFYDEVSGRWLGAWTPWQTVSDLPPAHAVRLPAKARIVVEVGYVGVEEPVTDTSEIGLYVEKAPIATVGVLSLAAPEATLLPGAEGHRVRVETTLNAATSVVALWPNPSSDARSIELTARTPEGVAVPLLWISDFRPQWRSSYVLSEPLTLPSGTRVAMTTYFDNPTDTASIARSQMWMLTAPTPNDPRKTQR
ncbi:MAG: hypothetical protein ACT4QD_13605 [Acidobacteriota bacterium]